MQNHQTSDKKGLDLSHYNAVTDWNAIKNSGIDFVYTKATQGTGFIDPKCAEFVAGAKSVGIPVGVYHYAGLNDAVAEANHFKQMLSGLDTQLIPVLDLEEGASGVDLVDWVRTFASTLGQKIILYTGNWFIEQYPELNQLSDIPLWTSYYKATAPTDEPGWSTWTIWQYSDKGTVPGVDGLVDVDYGVDMAHILKVIPQLTVKDYTRNAINSLAEKGYIQSPQLWLTELEKKGDVDFDFLAILLLDKVAK